MAARQHRNPTPFPRRSDQRSRGSPWRHHQQMYFHLAHQASRDGENAQPLNLHEELHDQVDVYHRYRGSTEYIGRPHGAGEQGGIADNLSSYGYGGHSQFSPQNEFVPHEYEGNVPGWTEGQEYSQPLQDALSPGAEMAYLPTSVIGRVPLVSAARYGVLETVTELYERYVWEGLQDAYYGPTVTNYGTLSFVLRYRMRVDITVDYAIRIVNLDRHCSAAISSWGESSSVCHERGCAVQQRMHADVITGAQRARISRNGVTFTALNHRLAYFVDASGIGPTAERFENINPDHSMRVFRSNSEGGLGVFGDCVELMNRSRSHTTVNGDDIWNVGLVRIKQTSRGDVQVSRSSGELVIRCSTGGKIFVATPYVKMCASTDPRNYFYAIMGQKSIRSSSDGFAVKNGIQEAGFDRWGRLTLL